MLLLGLLWKGETGYNVRVEVTVGGVDFGELFVMEAFLWNGDR